MEKPKMILFDFGETLVNYKLIDAVKGTEAVLSLAKTNPLNVKAEEVQALADQILFEVGRYGAEPSEQPMQEFHNHVFQNYLYSYFGIELDKTQEEIEELFERNAFSPEPTIHIAEFLAFLEENKIRTAVISNISFSGKLLKRRIDEQLPKNQFEFIIASSEYLYRKPHPRIFEIALRKAGLKPQEAWYCGDNAVFDVDGAAASGIFPVWYRGAKEKNNKYAPKSNCLEIQDWLELKDILKDL